MRTRKKTEWMKAGAIALLCGALFPAASWAQKKPLDLDACMTWKRVDSPDLSPSGRWVTYRVVPLEASCLSCTSKEMVMPPSTACGITYQAWPTSFMSTVPWF